VNPATIGTSANILNTDNFQPQVNQWSFDIQRQLPWTMALNVGYIGSKTTHLDQTVELNAPDPAFNTATSTHSHAALISSLMTMAFNGSSPESAFLIRAEMLRIMACS
jgi:hypothetical protein